MELTVRGFHGFYKSKQVALPSSYPNKLLLTPPLCTSSHTCIHTLHSSSLHRPPHLHPSLPATVFFCCCCRFHLCCFFFFLPCMWLHLFCGLYILCTGADWIWTVKTVFLKSIGGKLRKNKWKLLKKKKKRGNACCKRCNSAFLITGGKLLIHQTKLTLFLIL